MILMFENICDTIRDTHTENIRLFDILSNPKFNNFPSLVCDYYDKAATFKEANDKAIMNYSYGRLKTAWAQCWHLDADPGTPFNHFSGFNTPESLMLREYFMIDEIFWRKVLSHVFGDLVSVRTGISDLKTKLMSVLVSDDLDRRKNKKDLKKPWHDIAVKILTVFQKRTEKRSLSDATESAAKRQAVIPDVDGDQAKNMAADTLISLHGS